MPQTYQDQILDSISTTPRAGQTAEPVRALRSGRVAQVNITPGVLVVPGTLDVQAKLPTSAAEVAKGIGVAVLFELGYELSDDYGIGRAVTYLDEGEIWVAVEEAVAQGDQAFARYASGGGGAQLGAFRKSADTSTAAAVPGCRFMSTTSGAGFARLRVKLPATG